MTFSYVRDISIGATVGVPTSYQQIIKLDNTNFDFSKVLSTGIDFYFTASDGVTPLPFHRRSFDATGETAEFAVLVPTISDSEATVIKMFYGDSGASDLSDGASTYVDFDDTFDDLDKYTNTGLTVSVSDGILTLSKTVANKHYFYSNTPITCQNVIFEGKVKGYHTGASYAEYFGLIEDTNTNYALFGHSDALNSFLTKNNGTYSVYDIGGVFEDDYHNYRFEVNDSTINVYKDDVFIIEKTSNIPIGQTLYMGAMGENYATEYIDFWLLRKYSANVPTYSVGVETANTGDSIYAGYVLLSNTNYKEFSVTGNGETTVFALPHENIFSFVKVMNGETELVEDTDYTIDRFNGEITFTTAIADGTTYDILYLYGTVKTAGAGVTVNLLNASGTVVDTTTTNYAGYFSFTVSTAGTYKIQPVTDLFDNYAEVIKE